MNIKNLKVGDKIKYKGNQPNFPEPCEMIGEISSINCGWGTIEIKNCGHIRKENIICKIEPSCWYNDGIIYKEIPIEKEICDECEEKSAPKTIFLKDLQVGDFVKTMNGNYYIAHLPDNDRPLFYLTVDMSLKYQRYIKATNDDIIAKLIPTSIDYDEILVEHPRWPRSFKFEFNVEKIGGYLSNLTINGRDKTENRNLIVCSAPDWIELGKTYIVEIKEK
jgi:hypothetical protein